ncbi:UvrD-helicase domain-containing protein, partial [candidate division KSB1 bacterium]|nr:UvrD-helicase domain-containing protein [candidate division KSB1 bacterium]
MQTLVNKVIRASAGTGKTYRLSLEYIGLLLQYRQLGLAYNEILVITFTRKATAEIRNRIFQHLQLLCENPSGEEAKKLEYNLKDCLGVRLREEDRDYLRQVYHDMLMNKNRVEISTIDAFTNKIFVNIIAPFLGLEPRAIKKAMDAASINELNAHALVPENLAIIKSMFMRTKKRSVEDYAEYIHSIIRDRWIFHFLDQYAGGHDHLMQQTEIIDRRLQNFRAHFSRLADLLQAHALQKEKIPPLEGIVKKDYSFLIREGSDDLNSFSTYIKGKIADLDFIISHVDDWFADEPFWNKISIFNGKKYDSVRSEALEALRTAQSEIAEYFYLTLFLAEERELRRIADMLLEKYDQLTLRDKVFTHSDITYAT